MSTRKRQDLLITGETLTDGEYLISLNNRYCACLHRNGHISVYRNPVPDADFWLYDWPSTDPAPLGDKCAYLWGTGLLCIYNSKTVDPATQFGPGHGVEVSTVSTKCLCLHDDGNLCTYNSEFPGANTNLGCYGLPDKILGPVINYHIIVYTKDETLAGTDNFVSMTMHGDNGSSDEFELQGSLEQNKTDITDIPQADFGIAKRITINVKGTLADKWTPYYIRILRNTKQDDPSTANGWSEFLINKELGYDPEDFTATTIVDPQTVVSPFGEPVANTERITIVQFDHNPGQTTRTVMKYKETWSNIDRVQISTENHETIQVGTKIKYSSPEIGGDNLFTGGKLSVELGVSWQNEIAEIRQNETTKISQREFDWSFEADPKTYVFRLQVFQIPYTDQIYRDTVGNSRAIRKLRSEVIPAHMGDFLCIPRMDDDKIDPILLSELENDWFIYMNSEDVQWIRQRHLDRWLAKGWVTPDNKITTSKKEQNAIVITDALNIREGHDPKSKIIGYLKEGDEVTILDTWTEGNNIWAKLKPSSQVTAAEQWAALFIGKNRYIQSKDHPTA